MPEYTYTDDYEREWTQKFEGAYTPEEIELNKKLKEECCKDDIDFELVEELLKQGADPLGGTAICGWDLLEHVYGEAISASIDTDCVNLPRLTEVFLKYGMDVDNPRVPYDDDESLHPLWFFSFRPNENTLLALKMLLDHGLSATAFGEFWGHSLLDFSIIECGDPENDEFWNEQCVWTLKMMLLGATYDRVLEDDAGLREYICCSLNKNDVHIFRDWDDFEYHFDTSHCSRYPQLDESIIHIFSKKSGDEVWTIDDTSDYRKKQRSMDKDQRPC